MSEKKKKTPTVEDTVVMNEWIEGVGGQIRLGEGKIKSVEVSKRGDRLTLVIKKKTIVKKKLDQSVD